MNGVTRFVNEIASVSMPSLNSARLGVQVQQTQKKQHELVVTSVTLQDTALLTMATCIVCNQSFDTSNNSETCAQHSGFFINRAWTCCQDNQKAIGCTQLSHKRPRI